MKGRMFGEYLFWNGASFAISGNNVHIGTNAGHVGQGTYAIAMGVEAGTQMQNDDGISIGRFAGQQIQGQDAIAIGREAGRVQQEPYSIAIGCLAGASNIASSSIILNASGAPLDSTEPSLHVRPIAPCTEMASSLEAKQLLYDPDTAMITWAPASLYCRLQRHYQFFGDIGKADARADAPFPTLEIFPWTQVLHIDATRTASDYIDVILPDDAKSVSCTGRQLTVIGTGNFVVHGNFYQSSTRAVEHAIRMQDASFSNLVWFKYDEEWYWAIR